MFRLTTNSANLTERKRKESFLLSFYHDFYLQLSKRLKVDVSLLDYNMTRMLECIEQVVAHYHLKQTALNMDELESALEFYLQIDGQ